MKTIVYSCDSFQTLFSHYKSIDTVFYREHSGINFSKETYRQRMLKVIIVAQKCNVPNLFDNTCRLTIGVDNYCAIS